MNKNYFFLIILIFLSSCQDVKNALTGKKYEDHDEFISRTMEQFLSFKQRLSQLVLMTEPEVELITHPEGVLN